MNIKDIIRFSENIKGNVSFDYNLNKLNWFNIGGRTKIFFKPSKLNELIEFLKIYKNREKIFILGAGSNVLISDETFNGVVIKLGDNFKRISKMDNEKIIAGSGVLDKKLSEFAMDNEIGGLEFLSCIPGSVGGGIRMNSGCYNTEFKDVLLSVQAIDFTGKVITIPSNKIKFSYRGTNLPKDLIFLSATFKGKKEKRQTIEEKIIKLKLMKEKTQPSKVKTGGSTFKNPVEKSDIKVWQLIKNSVPENINFGDARISNHHSNFLINKKKAKLNDMIKLINFIKKNVKKKFNIDLELEVVLVE